MPASYFCGGFLPFSAAGITSPIPGNLQRDRGPCDYDVRHNLTASYVYELPIKIRHSLPALFPACRYTNTNQFPVSLNQARFSG